MGNASALAGLLLLFGATTASPAAAQTVTVDGAYAKLSTGNAKIARALYEAQVQTAETRRVGSASVRGSVPRPLTLDQIAAQKQGGQAWSRVFESMRAQGLLQDKSLGQVVSRYEHRHQGAVAVVTADAPVPTK